MLSRCSIRDSRYTTLAPKRLARGSTFSESNLNRLLSSFQDLSKYGILYVTVLEHAYPRFLMNTISNFSSDPFHQFTSSRIPRTGGSSTRQNFWQGITITNKQNIFMPNTKFIYEVDSWLAGKRHSFLQQSSRVSFIHVGTFVGFDTDSMANSVGESFAVSGGGDYISGCDVDGCSCDVGVHCYHRCGLS